MARKQGPNLEHGTLPREVPSSKASLFSDWFRARAVRGKLFELPGTSPTANGYVRRTQRPPRGAALILKFVLEKQV